MGNGHCFVDREGITRALGKRQGMAGRVNLYHRIWAAPLLGKKGGMDGQSSRVLEERSSWGRGHHKLDSRDQPGHASVSTFVRTFITRPYFSPECWSAPVKQLGGFRGIVHRIPLALA